MRTKTTYHLVTHLLGENANGSVPESFNSYDEAVKHWEVHFRNRNKGDGYDEYWRKTPLRVQQIITNDLWTEIEPTQK